MSRAKRNRREFARIAVQLRVRFRIVRGEEVEAVERALLEAPSVWAPAGESELLKLATSSGRGSEGFIAQAILDVCRQIGRLSHHAFVATGPTAVGEFLQLSGGGALMATRVVLTEGTHLDLRLSDEDLEAPPVRILAKILGGERLAEGEVPVKFVTLHPTDRERLIRFLHALQRRELRRAHRSEN